MDSPDSTEQVITRLSEDVYKQLESTMPQPFVSTTTTDLQAGFALGVQHVLGVLRRGFVTRR